MSARGRGAPRDAPRSCPHSGSPLRGRAGGVSRTRRRASPRRRSRARDRAALRPARRAGRRAARGGDARLRGGRPLGARRARRRRAPDRPQHGADHGDLRPHPRTRPGNDARRGRRPGRSAPTSMSPPRISAKRPVHRGMSRRSRRGARTFATAASRPSAACRSRSAPGESSGLIGRERRRASHRRCTRSWASRRSSAATCGSASESLRGRRPEDIARKRHGARSGGAPHLGELTVEENLRLGFAARRGRRESGGTARRVCALPDRGGVPGRHAGALRAASSSSLRSPVRSSPSPTCSCWTSRRSASRRAWSTSSSSILATIRDRGLGILLVEQRAQRTVAAADRCLTSSRTASCASRSARTRPPTPMPSWRPTSRDPRASGTSTGRRSSTRRRSAPSTR